MFKNRKNPKNGQNPTGQCLTCYKPIRYEDKYCAFCGTMNTGWVKPTSDQCGNCHAYLEQNDKYCRICGTKVGDGAYEPYQDIQQCVYGPMPVYREHRCKKCGFSWTTCFMIDDEKYCPQCGGKAPYREIPDNEVNHYIRLTDKNDPNAVWTCRIDKEILIGRDRNADISFDSTFDSYIARRQCRMRRSGNAFYIEDLGSANRTYVNGSVIEAWNEHSVFDGNEITMGRHTFVFECL